ncbi:MAG: Rpn family recombination-promoting nuclease/putative transposase [Lachnospiraceae bacterium]|nr:Rpn family recombination-promoting nuclease/putative transposase [Lachnospiraceae bacterium]
MAEFLMKPRVDYVFKEIMMDEKARIGFLSAILKLNPEDIKETQMLNTNLRKQSEKEKLGILDVRILMNNNTEIDIEIQLAAMNIWADRALFYLAKMYTEQISAGEDYTVFKKCVSISILDFNLFEHESEFYSCFHIREDSHHFLYTNKMEFHVLELPKLPKELQENSSDIELWAKFIRAERKEEFDMLAEKNAYIGSAYQHLQVISQDEEKRLEYEAREKAIRDYNQIMLEAKQIGRAEGREEGRAEGREEGEVQGEARGRAAERIESIRIFITDNIEESVTKEKTIIKLQKHYQLTEKEAEQYYEKYSKME